MALPWRHRRNSTCPHSSGRESAHIHPPPLREGVNSGPGGRCGLCAIGANSSVAASATGPSARPVLRAGLREQESVETRARVHASNQEVSKIVQPDPGAQPVPNYLRPCVSLDVHKGSITATRMEPGGQVQRTWTLPTTRSDVLTLAGGIPVAVPVVLEASTAGKAVAQVLKEQGLELHMAAPNKIPKPAVKTDKRDSIRLGHLYQSGSMPECYVPPPEIEHLRLLTRNRKDLAHKVTLVKNQVHALVTRNLLDSEMKGVSDWFGVGGCRSSLGFHSRPRTEPTWRATSNSWSSSPNRRSPCRWSSPRWRRGARTSSF